MTSDQAIADLVRRGAMMTPVIGGGAVPVGFMRRVGAGRWFWWAAGGDTEFDAHMVTADAAHVLYGGQAVEFLAGGRLVAYLTTIAESLDDEGAAQKVADLISAWQARYDRDAPLRAFIQARMKPAEG